MGSKGKPTFWIASKLEGGGSSLTSNQTSSIRFSVEESVWFKKGQEVSDLIAMSLDPEISVQEHEDYISIRGALVLTGDYLPLAVEEEEQEVYSLRDTAIYKTVDEVIENDGGTHSMKHRFPIDITIPTNRIRSLEEVYVLIEAFDYEIPERGRLELKADLCISGIANERESLSSKQQTQVVNPVANELQAEPTGSASVVQDETIHEAPASSLRQNVNEAVNNSNNVSESAEKIVETKFPSFSTEVRKAVNNEENEEDASDFEETVEAAANDRAAAGLSLVPKFEQPQAETISDEAELNRLPDSELELAELELEKEAEPEPEPEVPVNIVAKKQTPQIGVKGRSGQQNQDWNPKGLYSAQQTTYNRLGSKENVQEIEEEQEETLQRSKRTENALYLTKMLSSGEDDFSKLRIRIVQSGETLGSIAENYDISANQIIRLNGLEDDVLKEGQILYIPEYAGVEK